MQGGNSDSYAYAHGFEKANFIRMRNISLGYVFPEKLIGKVAKHVKVYGQVINPFDIYQSVDGFDLDTGNTYYNRSWVLGLELGF